MPTEFRQLFPTDLSHCDSARSFLQSGFWGSFKAFFAWNARAFLVDWGDGGKLPILVLRRRLGPFASFAYLPWGPELPDNFPLTTEACSEALAAIAKALKDHLPRNTAFLRCDPPWYIEEPAKALRLSSPFKRAGADIQAPDTVIVDLSLSEEELLAGMKSKWRYNIRLAERRGVKVRQADTDGLETFYRLLQSTARRDKIAIHGKRYYERLFQHAAEYRAAGQELRLYLAEREEPISALIVLFRSEEATYLYGASSDHCREMMANYALQWRIMQDAKAFGCKRYDLFGIPPDASDHPMAGLYRFKTGFGGRIIHRPGCWDYEYKPLTGALFRCVESLRKGFRTQRKAWRRRSPASRDGRSALPSDD